MAKKKIEFTNETRKKWVEALRSGKHKQARGRLCATTGAMCCLGVLDHILGRDKHQLHVTEGQHGSRGGLTAAQRRKFVDLNDVARLSFKQIASVIENKVIV
jgi:hypothetical protein